jgi:hypothetical protein
MRSRKKRSKFKREIRSEGRNSAIRANAGWLSD